MSDRAARDPLLTRDFGLLAGGHALQAIGYSSLMLLPLYLDALGATSGDIGLVSAAGAAAGLLSRPLVGYSLDALGRRPTLFVGTALAMVGMGAIGLVTSLGVAVYAARIILGLGVSALFTGYFTFVTDIIPASRRTEGIALFGITGILPLLVNPLAHRVGVQGSDVRWFIPAVAIVVGFSFPLLARLREAPPTRDRNALTWYAVRHAVLARSLWPVWVATIVFSSLVTVFAAFVTVTAERRGMADPTLVWLTYPLAAVCVRLFGARLPDRLGPSNVVAPALALYGAAFLLAAEAVDDRAFLWAGALAGVAHGYGFPVLTAQVVTRIPDHLRGSGLSVFTAVWGLTEIGATPSFGVFADAFGDEAMFGAGAVFAMVGIASWAVLERRIGRFR